MANFFSLQDGNLTDASVYGYSLTGAEIMNNTTGTMLLTSTVFLYSSNYSSDGSTLSAIAVHLSARSANPTGTLGLTLQRTVSAGVFLDNSSNNLTVTTVGSAYNSTFSPFSPNGWSAYFPINGTIRYGTQSNWSFLHNTTAKWTIEFWIFPSQGGTAFTIFDTANATTANAGIYINMLTSNKIAIQMFYGSAGNYILNTSVIATNPLNIGSWNHVALTYDASLGSNNLTFYINGVSSGSFSKTTNTPSNNAPFYPFSIAPTEIALGHLSNVRVLSGVILYTSNFTPSASPLTNITGTSLLTLQDNRFKDNSNNNFTLTANGSVAVKDTSPFTPVIINPAINGGSGYFGGSQYITIPYNSIFDLGLNPYTIECWIYPTLNVTGTAYNIFQIGYHASGNKFLEMGILNNTVYANLYNGTSYKYQPTVTGNLSTNSWNHISLCFDGTSACVSLNGIIGTKINSTAVLNDIVSGQVVNIGRVYDANLNVFFNGYISNVRLIKGTALYTSNFTPSTSPLTNISGTSLLLNTSNYGMQTSTTETYAVSSFTSYDGSNNLLTPYPQNWQILKLTNPLNTNRGDVINYTLSTSSPNQLSLMGAAASATDITGVNRLSTVGSPTLTSFKPYPNFDDSWYLNSNIGAYTVPANTNLNFTGDFTIEFWVNTTVFSPDTQYRSIITFGPDSANNLQISFLSGSPIGATSNLGLYTNAMILNGSIAVANGSWHHIAVVRYNNALSLYVDGVRSGSISNTTAFNIGVTNGMYIGIASTLNTGRTVGYLNNLRIVNGTAVYTTSAFTPPTTPLTNIPNTVLLMKNGVRYDQALITANSVLTGSMTMGSATLSTISPYDTKGWCVYFNGVAGSYLNLPASTAFSLGGDFTMEAWVYPASANASSMPIMEIRTAAINTTGIAFGRVSNANTLFVYSNGFLITTTAVLTTGMWQHVSLVRNGTSTNNCTLYLNGVSVGTVTNNSSFTDGATTGPKIGGSTSTNEQWTGYMSNVRIIKGQALYTTNFTPPTAAFKLTDNGGAVGATVSPLASNVSLLTLQNSYLKDNSNNNFFISPNSNTTGNPSISAGSPFTPEVPYSQYIHDASIYYNNTPITISSNFDRNNFDISSGQNWTIELWAYRTADSTGVPQLFSVRNTASTNVYGIAWYPSTGSGVIQFMLGGNGAFTATTRVYNNTWNHIAFCNLNGKTYLYVNGVLDPATPYTTPTLAALDSGTTIMFGHYQAGTGNWDYKGYICNFKMTKGVALYTSNFTPPTVPVVSQSIGTAITTSITSYKYTPAVGDVHIGSSLKGLNTESRTIQADNYSFNNLYVHNQGILTFPITANKTLTLVGSAGLQITSDGTLNVGTSSSVVPLSTTHTIVLSNTQIDVHNGGNLNVYGYPKLFTTNLVSDYAVGTNTFTVTDPVSSIWKVGDILTFKPNLSARTGFDTLTIASFTGANTLSTTSNSLFFHTGSATYANIAGVYNLNRNVIIQGSNSTARGTIRTIDSAKTNINYASLSNFGLSSSPSILTNNNLSGFTSLSGIVINNDNTINVSNIASNSGFSNNFNANVFSYPDSTALSLAGSAFTIECWLNPTGNYNSFNVIFTKRNAGTSTCSYQGLLKPTTGYIGFYQNATEYASTYTLTPNAWSHCAWVYDGSKINIYVNGVNVLNTAVTITDQAYPLTIGGNSLPGEYFYGKLYGLRIIKGLALYTTNFTPTIATTLSNYTVTNSFSTVFLGLTATLNSNNSISAFRDSISNVVPTLNNTSLPTPGVGAPFNNVSNNLSVYNSIFNKSLVPFNLSYGNNNFVPITLNNVNISNNYILSSAGIGLQINNSTGSINMSNNTTIGSLSYGTYLFNNTLTGIYGANNFNSGLQGMMISGTNTGTIVGGGLNSAKEGVYVDASTSNLSGVTFQNISANNNSSVGFKVSGNSLNYLTPVTLNINRLVANTNLDSGFEAYNISGNLSSIVANNNYTNGIITSIGNGPTIFDGVSSFTNTRTLPFSANTGATVITNNTPFNNYSDLSSNLYIPANKLVALGTVALTGDFTVEFWYKTSAIGTNTTFFRIGSASESTGDFGATARGGDGAVSFGQYGPNNTVTAVMNGVAPGYASANNLNWNHFAFVRRSGLGIMFMNGVSSANSYTYIAPITGGIYLNGITVGVTNINFSNIRISNSAIYTTNNFTVPTSALTILPSTLYLVQYPYTYSYLPNINIFNIAILSANNYNQFVIKNAILSADHPIYGTSLSLTNVDKLEEFRLEGSTLSAATPFKISSARSKLEGSYLFHGSNSDVYGLSALALTGYQSDTFTEAGISVINENGLSGSAIRYLASGTISYDASVKHITSNIASEKLEPKSSFIKLRSSSRLIPIKSGSSLTISVYIKKSLNYTGAAPRLMVVGNSAIGYNDQVLATSSSVNDTWEPLTGTLPSSTDPGIVEIYVDCSGSTGSGTINIDDWNFS